MRRIAIRAAVIGIGVLVVHRLMPRLHARLEAQCQRAFERMPDEFPPKRMLQGIEETRANTAQILGFLEEQRKVSVSAPPLPPPRASLRSSERREVAGVPTS